jgi:hypothetical protein
VKSLSVRPYKTLKKSKHQITFDELSIISHNLQPSSKTQFDEKVSLLNFLQSSDNLQQRLTAFNNIQQQFIFLFKSSLED